MAASAKAARGCSPLEAGSVSIPSYSAPVPRWSQAATGGAFVASAGNRSQKGISGRIKARAAWHPASRSRHWEMPDEEHGNRSEQPWTWTGSALQLTDTSAGFSSLLLYRSVSTACRGLHGTARRFLTPLWHCYTAASRKTAPGS